MKKQNHPGQENDERHPLADRWSEAINYENTRKEIGDLIRDEKRKERLKNRWIVYSAAASVVIAFGLFGIIRPFAPKLESDKASLMATKDSSVNGKPDSSKTLNFNEDQPRKFAFKDSVTSDTSAAILISPDDSATINRPESIKFKWVAMAHQSAIRILLYPQDSLVVSFVIRPSDSVYNLDVRLLKPGWYTWSIAPGTKSRKFRIIK